MADSRKTPGYVVLSKMGTMRLAPAERQRKRYGFVLYWGAAATVFCRRPTAEAAITRTVQYRAEMYGTRPDRGRRRYWIVRLGPVWDGHLAPVQPAPRRKKRP